MGNPTHRGIYAYGVGDFDAARGIVVTYDDGVIAEPNESVWVQLVNPTVTGDVAIAGESGDALLMAYDGTFMIEYRGFLSYNYGKEAVFGYSINGGEIIELGRVKINSNSALLVRWQRAVQVSAGNTLELYITGAFQFAPLSWTGMQIVGVEAV